MEFETKLETKKRKRGFGKDLQFNFEVRTSVTGKCNDPINDITV